MKMPKQVYRSRRRSYPPCRNRPPWPMSAKERLYERRKRSRNTRIKSEYLKWLGEALDFCQYCPNWEDDEDDGGPGCPITATRNCPYEREAHAYYMSVRADVRRHRPTRKERLYERRKRLDRRRKWANYVPPDNLLRLGRWTTYRPNGRWWLYRSDIVQRPCRKPGYNPRLNWLRR